MKLKFHLSVCLMALCFYSANAQLFPTRQYTTNDELANSNLFDICHDEHGYLWFATERGLSRFDGYKFTNYLFKEGLEGAVVTSLSKNNKGEFYAGTKYDGIYKLTTNYIKIINASPSLGNDAIEATDNFIYSLKLQANITLIDLKDTSSRIISFPISNIKPNCIYKSPKGDIYAGTNVGVFLLNGSDKPKPIFTQIQSPVYSITSSNGQFYFGSTNGIITENKIINLPEAGNITRIFIDKNNELWAASFPKSNLYQITDGRINKFSDKLNLQGISVNKIMEDKEGNIWFATYGKGAFCLHHRYCENYTAADGLTNEYITSLKALENGSLTIGTYDGVYILNENGIQIHKHNTSDLEYIIDIAGSGDSIYALVGGQKNKIFSIGNLQINNNYLGYRNSSALLVDGKTIYYSMWDHKVYSISTKSNDNEAPTLVFYDSTDKWQKINKIFKGADERLWLGTNRGLYIVDHNGAFQKLDTGYFNTNITSFAYDNNGSLLIGSDNGLITYAKNNWTYAHELKGKNLESISSIAVDDKSRIWIGTLNGLYLKSGKSLLKFDTKNTLISDEINALVYDAKLNILWIGTTYGLSKINLSLFDKTPVNPPVAIFKSLRAADSIYRELFSNNTVSLSHKQGNLTVRFSALNFSSPDGIKFLYKLDDAPWQPTIGRQIEFAGLPYGKHVLLLKSFGEQEIEGPVATLNILIATPFWATLWFKIVVGLIIGFLVYYILKKRFEAVRKKEQERLELQSKVAELRHQALAASMNPHFIFNALNSIQHFINTHNTEEATEYLGKFARLIRMILDNGGKTFIPLKDELERLNYYLELEKIRFGKKLEYTINLDADILNNEQEIPNMVIQPVVENALWHGLLPANRDGHLVITFTKNSNGISVVVDDDGIGINQSVAKKKGTHKSLGITMIRERLMLLKKLSGYEATITVQDKSVLNPLAQGTLVEINLQ